VAVEAEAPAVVEPEAESAIPPEVMEDPPPIPPESSFEPKTPVEEQSGGTLKYWLILIVLIVGGSTAAFFFRNTVVHYFPAANKVFMMVGFPANMLGFGLKIQQPKPILDVKTRVLAVKGMIENETGKIIDVPLLKATLLNAKGEALKSWTFKAKEPRILPSEKVVFETSIKNPPRGAQNLKVTFTTAEEEEAEMAAKKAKDPQKSK
jgi:hypothetical protein